MPVRRALRRTERWARHDLATTWVVLVVVLDDQIVASESLDIVYPGIGLGVASMPQVVLTGSDAGGNWHWRFGELVADRTENRLAPSDE